MSLLFNIFMYPLLRLHALATFVLAATCTHWPSFTRHTILILPPALLLAITQTSLTIYLVAALGRMPGVVVDCPGEVDRPLVYAENTGGGVVAVGQDVGRGALAAATLTSLLPPFLLLAILALHISRGGVSQRTALFAAFGWFVCLTCVAAAVRGLDVDGDTTFYSPLDEVRWCWVTASRMQGLLHERGVRRGVGGAIAGVFGGQVLCVGVYVVGAVAAAVMNARRARGAMGVQGLRLGVGT